MGISCGVMLAVQGTTWMQLVGAGGVHRLPTLEALWFDKHRKWDIPKFVNRVCGVIWWFSWVLRDATCEAKVLVHAPTLRRE